MYNTVLHDPENLWREQWEMCLRYMVKFGCVQSCWKDTEDTILWCKREEVTGCEFKVEGVTINRLHCFSPPFSSYCVVSSHSSCDFANGCAIVLCHPDRKRESHPESFSSPKRGHENATKISQTLDFQILVSTLVIIVHWFLEQQAGTREESEKLSDEWLDKLGNTSRGEALPKLPLARSFITLHSANRLRIPCRKKQKSLESMGDGESSILWVMGNALTVFMTKK